MVYTKDDCIQDTQAHIEQVRKFMFSFAMDLFRRALIHDESKMKSPELEIFTEYTPKLKGSTYGSEEYKTFLEGMGTALKHHYANNSHHPEHFENGIKGMNLADVVEMLCDWKAATMRHDNGDLEKSIEYNKGRFNYSDDLESIFKNTISFFESGDK